MEQLDLTVLGGELRAWRQARGLNRATLAQAVGTRPVIIGRWERGEGTPTPAQVRVLADVLELPSSLAADWEAAAERVGSAAGAGGAPSMGRGEWWLPWRQSLARLAGPGGEQPLDTDPTGDPPSYLDNPAERRRYTIRWAVTLAILGALAILLVWALGELADGWRALLDLFRSGPATGGGTSAFGLLGAG